MDVDENYTLLEREYITSLCEKDKAILQIAQDYFGDAFRLQSTRSFRRWETAQKEVNVKKRNLLITCDDYDNDNTDTYTDKDKNLLNKPNKKIRED
jgi:hypothetical protein